MWDAPHFLERLYGKHDDNPIGSIPFFRSQNLFFPHVTGDLWQRQQSLGVGCLTHLRGCWDPRETDPYNIYIYMCSIYFTHVYSMYIYIYTTYIRVFLKHIQLVCWYQFCVSWYQTKRWYSKNHVDYASSLFQFEHIALWSQAKWLGTFQPLIVQNLHIFPLGSTRLRVM